jgi:hypothetical protein
MLEAVLMHTDKSSLFGPVHPLCTRTDRAGTEQSGRADSDQIAGRPCPTWGHLGLRQPSPR